MAESFSRRDFLLRSAALAAAGTLATPKLWAQPRFTQNPFSLGVASGYPQPDGIVLWTRLAPEPLHGGGMPNAAVEVKWEIAADEAFRKIVRSGAAAAVPEDAHSVHAEIKGLEPTRQYFYRFHAADATSAVGRFRTAPAQDAANNRLRFALASCQHYEQGYYTAYRGMADEDFDLILHVGDYIYESPRSGEKIRQHLAPEPRTLDAYRNRYALYKSDAHLHAAHASAPWIVTWDDHEVQNDYANSQSQNLDPPEEFLKRRAAAYKAYYEHMPLPSWARPRGPDARLYTQSSFGQLVQLYVLDDRQYRSPQVCPRPGRGGSNTLKVSECPERQSPSLTLLGAEQEKWLANALSNSKARWNVIAQQTLMAQSDRNPSDEQSFWTDGWDGYPKARERLLTHVVERNITNPLVLGGDVHTAIVADLKLDFNDPKSPVIASEILGPSITSRGPSPRVIEALRHKNPHFKFANPSERGYASFEISAQRCTAHMRTVSTVSEQVAQVRSSASFVVEDGKPGAQRL